jgi:branched-chain amino acid transport system ATP-binding protein/urea transport system ATP-binding protein
MSAAPILETRGLTCRFGGVTAVDNVDLIIAEGELRCLIGPNGAGKSTLFKCMTRQLRAASGDILLRGQSVVGSHPHQIARMGVAIKNQIASVYSGLSVRENIWVAGRRLHRGEHLERSVTAILNEIGFAEPSRFNLKVDALSHAHRQWVELGMLLATNPIVALLDEPAAGMTRDEMLKTIKLIRRLNESATIIVVEHDLEFISLLACTAARYFSRIRWRMSREILWCGKSIWASNGKPSNDPGGEGCLCRLWHCAGSAKYQLHATARRSARHCRS